MKDNILVVDTGNHRLLKFSQVRDLTATIGSKGDGLGQFMGPYDVCINSVNEKVYVVMVLVAPAVSTDIYNS